MRQMNTKDSGKFGPCLWAWHLGTIVEALGEQSAELASVTAKKNMCQNEDAST